MIWKIFKFEIAYRMTRPATWAYFGILFLFGFLNAIYGSSPASEKVLANSPAAITNMLVIISIFGSLIASAVMGMPVYRDLEHRTHHYYYTLPITEKDYLFGRYFGSLAILFLISLGMQLGLILGFALGPYLGLEEADRFGVFVLWHYVQPTITLYWTNLIFTGTIFFALVALTRKVYVTYSGSIILFIGYLLGLTFASDLDYKDTVSLLDPFAFSTFNNESAYWTPFEQNTKLLEFSGLVLWNRVIYLSLSIIIFAFVMWRFKFVDAFKVGGKKIIDESETKKDVSSISVPRILPSFSFGNYLKQMFGLAGLEFKNIIRDPYFLAILLGGFIFLFIDGWFGAQIYGTPSLPATYIMLSAKNSEFEIFAFILIIFYTGEAVHRDKGVGFSNIAYALPVPDWLIYGSKFLSLMLICALLCTAVMVSGVINQLLEGYTNFQFDMYLKDLFLLELPDYIQLTMLAFFVHILVNSKFLGHVVNIAIWIAMIGVRQFAEYDFNMLFYSYRPGYTISDINGFGHFWASQNWFNLYWLSFGTLLLIIGNLFWNRSSEGNFKNRLKLARQRVNKFSTVGIALSLLLFVSSGFVIYQNTALLNEHRTSDENKESLANYEKTYSKYKGFAQPKVSDLESWIDVYPSERRADAKANYTLFNPHQTTIDTLILNVGTTYSKIKSIKLDGELVEPIMSDEEYDFYFYTFPKPMEPGDTLEAEFVVEAKYDGFPNSGTQRDIVYNGTFFNFGIFPTFGYNAGAELTSDSDRKEYDLPEKDYNLPPVDDPDGKRNFLFEDDADYTTFRGTVSTEEDQVAVMPGYLQKEWVENGRRYFTYELDVPIQLFFNISSAKYAVAEDDWTGANGEKVKIQIFHHPDHNTNVDRFIDGTKKSLDYFSKHFGPYQHQQMRILEFPRYASFAQSFPNTVPYSESFGWIGDFSDPDDNDYVFTVTSHEVAHQWWGHVVAPSATRGSNQISETMAEYSSLMVSREKYGADAMQSFLKYELDRYLRGRANESKFEKTLLDNDNQSYVWYRKGGLILYSLADYVGHERLNEGFKAMVDSFGLKPEPPYATTADWYGFIKSVVPDSLDYYLSDSFENIVLYENKTNTATYEMNPDSTYTVNLTVNYDKIYYDGLGEELRRGEKPNLIEIGVFDEDSKNNLGMEQKTPMVLVKKWLKPGETKLKFTVPKKPMKAGIDPYNKLIDRIPDDNLINVEEAE